MLQLTGRYIHETQPICDKCLYMVESGVEEIFSFMSGANVSFAWPDCVLVTVTRLQSISMFGNAFAPPPWSGDTTSMHDSTLVFAVSAGALLHPQGH